MYQVNSSSWILLEPNKLKRFLGDNNEDHCLKWKPQR